MIIDTGHPHTPPRASGRFTFPDSYFHGFGMAAGRPGCTKSDQSRLFTRRCWLFPHPAPSRGGAQPGAVTKAAATRSDAAKAAAGAFREGRPEPSAFRREGGDAAGNRTGAGGRRGGCPGPGPRGPACSTEARFLHWDCGVPAPQRPSRPLAAVERPGSAALASPTQKGRKRKSG